MNLNRWIKWGSVCAILLGFVIFHLTLPEISTRLWFLVTGGDVATLVEFLRSFGAWAMFISLVLDIIINAAGFLPSIVISTANGIVFGLVPGILISWLAECIGVTISFLLMRSLFRDEAKKIVEKSSMLKKVDELSGRNGFKVMLFARMIPYFPSGIITALGALSSISVRDYILANLIGKFPSTALEVLVGHDVVNYQENSGRLLVIAVMLAGAYGISVWLRNRSKRRDQEEP